MRSRLIKSLLMLCVLLITLIPAPASAQAAPQFYDQETLIYWQKRYQRSMDRILREAILPFLTAEEKRKLAAVEIEIPLTTPGQVNPFEFYSEATGATVTMPALSLKFLDDLSLAYAWLSEHGCSLETPAEYVSMLKFNGPERFPGGRYPQPLVALQIPEDALEDEAVDELALAFFNHARAFILAHELGHIYYKHPGYGPDVPRATARRNEDQADQFALQALRGSATIPVGVLMFFFFSAHYVPNRWDFAGEAEWNAYLADATHPLTSARLYALAAIMEEDVNSFALGQPDPASARDTILEIASYIAGIARDLDDGEVQEAITLAAAETTVQDLAPRCPEAAPTGTLPALPAFQGVYSGDFVVVAEGVEDVLSVEMTLQRTNNDLVKGRFNFGLGAGSLDGMVVEDTLYFNWRWGWTYGKGVFYASQDGSSFEGTWGIELSEENGGRWSGHRIGE